MHDKKYFRFLILTFFAVLFSISLSLSARADSFFDDDGFFTNRTSDFNVYGSYTNNVSLYPDLVFDNDFTIPPNYILIAIYDSCSGSGGGFIQYIYGDSSTIYSLNATDSINTLSKRQSSDPDFYKIYNSYTSSFVLSYNSRQSGRYSTVSGASSQLTALVPFYDLNGDLVQPESTVHFVLNTAFVGDNLLFNSVVDVGDVSSVDYYLFPASAPITGGSVSTVVSSTPSNLLTSEQHQNFTLRGFSIPGFGLDDVIRDLLSPKSSLYVSSSVRSSLFDPSSYGVSFDYLGTTRLFPSNGSSISPSGSLSIKDILSRHSGVYSYTQLKLVAVVNYNSRSYLATFDFNPSSINEGQPVAPNSLLPSADYPSFSDPNSPYKDLADYLKDLAETQNLNDKRNLNNFLSMLNAFPFGAKIAPGIEMGLKGALPELSAELDDLFDGLFDKFTIPSDDDINDILNDIADEREDLDAKFLWINDVKTEIYYISSSILDSGDSPPYFSVVIPAHTLWRIERPFVLTLLDCSRIPSSTVSLVKNSITVFLSLSVVLYIWRTLPSTIGNIPKGD